MTIAVELTRASDGPDLLASLLARGLDGELRADGLGLVVDVEDSAAVEHSLDLWARERGLPFVPVELGRSRYALVPPAG